MVVPVHNEERALRPNVELLLDYLRTEFPFPVGVVIADNASTDATWEVACALDAGHVEVSALQVERKGGRALGGPRGGATAHIDAALAYVEAHGAASRFPLIVSSAQEAAPYVIAAKPSSMGGFTGGETVLTNAYLSSLVRRGEARYFLLGARVGSGRAVRRTLRRRRSRRSASRCPASARSNALRLRREKGTRSHSCPATDPDRRRQRRMPV